MVFLFYSGHTFLLFDIISTISKWLASIYRTFVQDDCSTYSNGRDFLLLLLASIFMPLQCSLRAFTAFVKDISVMFLQLPYGAEIK